MEIKMSVDRIMQETAICYDFNDNKYEIPVSLADFKVGDIIFVTYDKDNHPISLYVSEKETQKRKSDLSERTKNLFNRKAFK